MSDPARSPEALSVVLAAESYAQQWVTATGQRFDISDLIRLKGWFYAGAHWHAAHPDADVTGPQSFTMDQTDRLAALVTALALLVTQWREMALHEHSWFVQHAIGRCADHLEALLGEPSPKP